MVCFILVVRKCRAPSRVKPSGDDDGDLTEYDWGTYTLTWRRLQRGRRGTDLHDERVDQVGDLHEVRRDEVADAGLLAEGAVRLQHPGDAPQLVDVDAATHADRVHAQLFVATNLLHCRDDGNGRITLIRFLRELREHASMEGLVAQKNIDWNGGRQLRVLVSYSNIFTGALSLCCVFRGKVVKICSFFRWT